MGQVWYLIVSIPDICLFLYVYNLTPFALLPNFLKTVLIVKRYIRVGYNLDIMRQSACLVSNPITVYSYGFLFNCTAVDSVTALT